MIDARAKTIDIAITRGNSFSRTIVCKLSGEPYIFIDETDSMIFTLKKNISDETILLEKILPISDGKFLLELLPSDTENIPMKKTYKYDLEWTHGSEIYTLMTGRFELGEETTLKREGF